MARKAKPNSRTSIQFIAADDGAIGVEDEELSKAYAAYLQDFNEAHLKLKEDEVPSYYHLKVLPLDLQTKIRDALTTDGDDISPMDMFLSSVGKQLLGEFLNRCVVGVDSHPFVKSIHADGSFEEGEVSWLPGASRPVDLIDALLSEELLTINMFWFVFRASQLTGSEKKR